MRMYNSRFQAISAFNKTRLPPELRRVLSCKSPAVLLHFLLEEKGPWGPFYQLRRVLAKGRHLLQILLKALGNVYFLGAIRSPPRSLKVPIHLCPHETMVYKRKGCKAQKSSLLYVFVCFWSWQSTKHNSCFIMTKEKTRETQSCGPAKINLAIFVCSSEFCQASQPHPSIAYWKWKLEKLPSP